MTTGRKPVGDGLGVDPTDGTLSVASDGEGFQLPDRRLQPVARRTQGTRGSTVAGPNPVC